MSGTIQLIVFNGQENGAIFDTHCLTNVLKIVEYWNSFIMGGDSEIVFEAGICGEIDSKDLPRLVPLLHTFRHSP